MNSLEKQMLEILNVLHKEFCTVGVKAEFEAEGTRLEELLRLVEITYKANLELAIKVGGCEAIKDLFDAKQIGAEYIIAPMIESKYAVNKYNDSICRVWEDSHMPLSTLFNIETITAYNNINELVEEASNSSSITGIVFGRVDFALSNNLDRDEINNEFIYKCVLSVAEKCKERNLEFVVGGGVSPFAIDFLKKTSTIKLDRFETRKIIFDSSILLKDEEIINDALLLAVKFELLWLLNKKEYYSRIGAEDNRRLEMLEKRWKVLNL